MAARTESTGSGAGVSTVAASPLEATGPPVAAPAPRGDTLVPALVGAVVFAGWLTYYGLCLFPGLGGQLNPGDSAKFQILGHTPILVHGPGYPLVLMLGAGLRAIELPMPQWWTLTFALSALPAAAANSVAFLIVHRLSGSMLAGVSAALLLGSSGLMVIQATEAEVYTLNLAFVLTVIYLLVLFIETKNVAFFLSACAVYALSFGNHLMMIMLLPVVAWITLVYRRMILRPRPVALVATFVVLGASQYLYLAHVAHDPATSYSEYMPLPPEPMELVHYILGTYFGALYESGLAGAGRVRALLATLWFAHPWISMPMIISGLVLFAAGWGRRDTRWRGIAVVYAGALSFVPFVLWYGVPDIQAFHLPVLGPLLVAAVATFGWWLRRFPRMMKMAAGALVIAASIRAGQTAVLFADREPVFAELKPALERAVEQSPEERPIVAMEYGLRMAALYHELRGELPESAVYRLHWRAVAEIKRQSSVGGIVIPSDGYQFVRWIEHRRPGMTCRTTKVDPPGDAKWPAYTFECRQE